MMAPYAPVETCATQRAPFAREIADIDAELIAELVTASRKREAGAAGFQYTLLFERIEREHAKLAGQMVVADARESQRRLAWARAKANRAGSIRDAHQIFEQLADIAVGESKVAMTSLVFDREQSRIDEPLIVCLVTPAICASSVAVSAWPPTNAVRTSARARSPINAAMRTTFGPSFMVRC